jgi:hypothetical protein
MEDKRLAMLDQYFATALGEDAEAIHFRPPRSPAIPATGASSDAADAANADVAHAGVDHLGTLRGGS